MTFWDFLYLLFVGAVAYVNVADHIKAKRKNKRRPSDKGKRHFE